MTVITDSVQTGRFYNQAGTREFAPCTAWVNFDGSASPITIRDSLNVSSITDNGIGDYTVNFAQAMNNLNYSIIGTSRPNRTVGVSGYFLGSVNIENRVANDSTIADSDAVNVAIFGGITL